MPGRGRAGASHAAHCLAAESAQADFAISQRRIHSLPQADGTLPGPNPIRIHHPSGPAVHADPARYDSFASRSTAASSVSSFLQKQKRTCCAPSSGRW
jgi:hypothetical protein